MTLTATGTEVTRPPSQEVLSRLIQLLGERDASAPFTLEAVSQLASQENVPESHVLLAAAYTGVPPEAEGEAHTFDLCVAGCQSAGALHSLQSLLTLRKERQAQGQAAFHVRAVGCMNGCMMGPICRVMTPDGAAMIPRAGPDALKQVVAEAIDGAGEEVSS